MDDHLWLTYMLYLQDPRATPFKMLPGLAPPLGVCHRIVREAKRRWRELPKSPVSPPARRMSMSPFDLRAGSSDAIKASPAPSSDRDPMEGRAGSPDTIRPTHGAAQTVSLASVKPAKWPRSDAATRRRLRQLCKTKPSLSAHYQRLLRRSPSPFQSSSPASHPSSGPSSKSAFARDMNVSLVSSTAPSMQPDAPLMQLATSSNAPTPRPQRTSDWFARIPRSQAHQKSQSLQLGLGLQPSQGRFHTLASPFVGGRGRADVMDDVFGDPSSDRKFATMPPLDSAFETNTPRPLSNSLKRRFKIDEEVTVVSSPQPSNTLENLFSAPSESSQRRVRGRGFSLSAMGRNAGRMPSIFTPPPTNQQQDGSLADDDTSANSPTRFGSHLHRPIANPTPRLGSPFGGPSSTVYFNTFPRDPMSQGLTPTQSFEERLRSLAAQPSSTRR
ncbi:hypothetical protein LTR28_007538 [Elasticomyces elasticus]|nr:hypothetical protein LTR28_007538 [Elasticomyces elasticus]